MTAAAIYEGREGAVATDTPPVLEPADEVRTALPARV